MTELNTAFDRKSIEYKTSENFADNDFNRKKQLNQISIVN